MRESEVQDTNAGSRNGGVPVRHRFTRRVSFVGKQLTTEYYLRGGNVVTRLTKDQFPQAIDTARTVVVQQTVQPGSHCSCTHYKLKT